MEFTFPFKHWTSKFVIPFVPSSSFIFPPQTSIPDVTPFVSGEFSLPFSSVDLAVPPDEFLDFLHFDSAFSAFINVPSSDHNELPAIVSSPLPKLSPVRRSSRTHKPPSYLHDYHCNLAFAHVLATASLTQSHDSFISDGPSILYPLSSSFSYDRLSTSHRAFAIALTIAKEPTFYA